MIRYIALAAITLDGKIAEHKNHFSNWTSKEDKIFLHKSLDEADVILVGRTTYETAHKPLSKRNCIVFTRQTKGIQAASARLAWCNTTAPKLKAYLQAQKYKTVAVLGGSEIYTFCANNKILTDLYLTIEPMAFGRGINLFAPTHFKKQKFKFVSLKQLNKQGSILIHYKT